MWFFYTVATTLFWGAAELFYKKGSHAKEKYGHLKVCVCVGVVMGIHAVLTLLTQRFSYDPKNILLYFPVSFCYIFSMTASFFGIRFIEESIADPLENTSGAICTLLCVIFLGYSISGISIAAIALIVAGILGIGFLETHGETDRKKKLGPKLAVLALAAPFGYALFDAFGSFLDICFLDIELTPLAGVTEDTIELTANVSYELTFALFALGILIFLRKHRIPFELPNQKDKILAAICETAGQMTYVFAMSGNGMIAAPILSGVCAVSLLLSRVFLKEKLTKQQYFYIFLVIAGILILAAAEGE